MAQKKKAKAKRKRLNWKQPAMRIGALLVTIALVIGAILLVVYRDKVNLDALKRYITYRNLEKNDAGQTTEFTHGMPPMCLRAWTVPFCCARIQRCSCIPTADCCTLTSR